MCDAAAAAADNDNNDHHHHHGDVMMVVTIAQSVDLWSHDSWLSLIMSVLNQV